MGLIGSLALPDSVAYAQEAPLQPGEAYATRFSGTTEVNGTTVLDSTGTVGSIIDIRNPGQPPRGEHWWNEPQRHAVTAARVGQVFGVALDDASPPNIYLSATSAFGLHLAADGSGWMSGMWGADGGPGSVYKLNAANGYVPEILVNITLDGRANSGAALGNIAYDRWNRQLYVSDLETGMIHRISVSDGRDQGHYDHGMSGRGDFFDAVSQNRLSLPTVSFDPATSAQIDDCAVGNFSNTPVCWNFADFRRRVWGLGVQRDARSGKVRLYYAVWGSQGFGHADWTGAGDDRRNSLWSVAMADNGAFDTTDIRREFFLPAFFSKPDDIARAGFSHPVTDIAFATRNGQEIMILAERGGVRNLGPGEENAFARPHEARVLRYSRAADGTWKPQGRHDVGYYERHDEGQPYLRANSSGGVAFGYGYTQSWDIDLNRPDEFLWLTGHSLCSPAGRCFDSSAGEHNDSSQVHGMQGMAAEPFDELAPPAASQPYPASGPATPPQTPDRSAMIDFDINVNAAGDGIETELKRNDATRIGDVEIYRPRKGDGDTADSRSDSGGIARGSGESGGTAGGSEPEGGTDILPPPTGFDLGLEKAGPAQCTPGGECSYTITLTNHGPGMFSGPLLVQDGPDAGTEFISASDGWACMASEGVINCRHDPVTLPAGGSIALTLTVRLPGDIPENFTANCAGVMWPLAADASEDQVNMWVESVLQLQGYVVGPVDGTMDPATETAIRQYQADHGLAQTGTVNDALLASLFPGSAGVAADLNPANDQMCIQVPLAENTAFELGIVKNGPAQCTPGETCTFTITVTNHGAGDLPSPLAFDDHATILGGEGGPVPINGDSISFSAPGWTCGSIPGEPGIECQHHENLAAGESISLQVEVRIPDGIDGNELRNCATIRWSSMHAESDGNAENDRDCAVVPLAQSQPAAPELALTKIADDRCTPGAACGFNITVTNNGPGTFEGTLVIGDGLVDPDGRQMHTELVLPGPEGWNCEPNPPFVVNCRRPDTHLAPGETVSMPFGLRVPAGYDLPSFNNCAAIGWPSMEMSGDSTSGNDTACVTVATASPGFNVDLEVSTSAEGSCQPGAPCNISVLIRNVGPQPFHARLGIDGSLSPSVPIGRIHPLDRGWVCNGARAGSYQCRHNPLNLQPGGVQRFRLTVPIPAGFAHDRITHTVRLVWVEGRPDRKVTNNRASVTIPLNRDRPPSTVTPGVATPPVANEVVQPVICNGGVVRNHRCICRSGWRLRALRPGVYRCLPPRIRCINGRIVEGHCICRSGWRLRVTGRNAWQCVPPPRRVRCLGGAIRNGECVCPGGTTRRAIGRNAYRCDSVAAPVRCSGGVARGRTCICPRGWTRRAIGRNAFRCLRPAIRIRCSGGVVRGRACICPRGWTRRAIGRNAFRCIRPAIRIRCSGGVVRGRACICPRGWTRRSIGRNAYRCIRRAGPIRPGQRVRPALRHCPRGFIKRHGRCIRRVPLRSRRQPVLH